MSAAVPAEAYVISGGGVRMPRLIYGTAWKKSATAALVEQAIRCGFRGIDTACQPKHYDEAGVGAGLSVCLGGDLNRGALYLQSKFTPPEGQDPGRIPYDPAADPATQVAQSFQASRANLRTDYLDCLLLHSPLEDAGQTLVVWQAMEALVESGGVRQIGISNCYEPGELSSLCKAARIKPSVVQNRFYPATGYDREIRAYCRSHGMYYQSFWTLTANAHILADPRVRRLASAYARSPAQILFRYLTQRDVIPLTGTRSGTHMREDLAIFEFELSGAELNFLDGLF